MSNKARMMENLQKEINRVKSGVLLIVKLLNKDELNILMEDTTTIIDKFYLMVEKACEKASNHVILRTYDPTRLYIVLPDDTKIAERLAYSIYKQVQLYVDSQVPES